MQPKIAYLIDENAGWDEDPNWHFFLEADVPDWKIQYPSKDRVKKIVYWELDLQ